MASFLAVTGEKTDLWLVQTVGGLIAASGLGYLLEAQKKTLSTNLMIVAFCQASFLTFVDIYYVAEDVIAPIYLLDAIFEIAVAFSWFLIWMSRKSSDAN